MIFPPSQGINFFHYFEETLVLGLLHLMQCDTRTHATLQNQMTTLTTRFSSLTV